MKKYLSDLLKSMFKDLVSDLKEEYADNVMVDHYYVKYTLNTKKKGSVQIKVDSKSNFTHIFENKIIAKHDLEPTNVNYSIDYIFKL